MGSRGSVIVDCGVSGSDGECKFNFLQHFFWTIHFLTNQILNNHLIVVAFQNFNFIFLIQQIVAPSSINFKKRQIKSIPSIFSISHLKHILKSILLNSLHGECFARPSLTVGKDSNHAHIENFIQNGLNWTLIKFFCGLILIKSIVKFEVIFFEIFRNSVDFKFGGENF